MGGVRCLLHIVKLTFISSGCSYLIESHGMIEITMQELLPVPILNIPNAHIVYHKPLFYNRKHIGWPDKNLTTDVTNYLLLLMTVYA